MTARAPSGWQFANGGLNSLGMRRTIIGKFFNWLAPVETTPPAFDGKMALATLLVRLARSDDDYADVEKARIDQVLGRWHGLDSISAARMRSLAEDEEKLAPDTVRFTRQIKDEVALEDRMAVVEALWSVVLADGVREDEEDGQMRLIASLLGVNDRDSALARQRAALE